MLERDWYPAGVPCWVDTGQPDPRAAADFYGGLFGWRFEETAPEDSPMSYLVGRLRGKDVAAVASMREAGPPKPTWNTYVRVDSADAAAARAWEAGGRVLVEPMDADGAGRLAVIADPAGAVISVWEPREFQGANLVNEPGTWNFSELNTPDPEGAEAFYRALFGWEASTFDHGDGSMKIFRKPGYGDHLAELDPTLRERMADSGAPEGFEDAVAWLIPVGDEQPGPDVNPHWSITFAVDDADAAAARAAKLGGEVLTAPFDAPYVRMTVLRDPQGAVFTASKYVPENR